MKRKEILLSTLFMTISIGLSAQDSLDFLRSTGKIYAVVAGIVAMFVLIVLYLIRLDRKITKLEEN